jgi:hypothetical protein
VGRKEELDDLITAFDRAGMRTIPIPNVLVVRGDPRWRRWRKNHSSSVLFPCLTIFGIAQRVWMT